MPKTALDIEAIKVRSHISVEDAKKVGQHEWLVRGKSFAGEWAKTALDIEVIKVRAHISVEDAVKRG